MTDEKQSNRESVRKALEKERKEQAKRDRRDGGFKEYGEPTPRRPRKKERAEK